MIRRSYMLIIAVITVALTSTPFIDVCGEEVPITIGRISWYSYINPSRGKDVPYSVCGYGDWIYIVGSEIGDQGMPIPRIEKRLKSDGSLLAIWRGEHISGEFKDCVAFDNGVYAVGYVKLEYGVRTWVIAIFNEDLIPLNISIRREYRYWSEAVSITSLRGSVYVAGFIGISPSDTQWRIEKIYSNLSPILTYDVNPSNMYDMLMYFDVNPATGELWVVGINGLTGYWRIDVLSENLDRRYVFEEEMPGYGLPNAITFDENGFAYIAGTGIAIFNSRAELMQITTTFGYCPKIVYSDGIIYLFCTSFLEGYNRHILYAVDRQSFIAFTFILSSDINAYAYFANGRLHLDEKHLYISGYIELEDSGGWIIYSVDKIPSQIPVEYVVTEPYTTTITTTISFQDLIEQIKRETYTTPQIERIEIAEQRPSTDTKTVLLTILLIAISLALIFLMVRKRRRLEGALRIVEMYKNSDLPQNHAVNNETQENREQEIKQ